jgi:hypothetical protein
VTLVIVKHQLKDLNIAHHSGSATSSSILLYEFLLIIHGTLTLFVCILHASVLYCDLNVYKVLDKVEHSHF